MKGGGRRSGRSALAEQHDDNDDSPAKINVVKTIEYTILACRIRLNMI